jgi:hypothetical protein
MGINIIKEEIRILIETLEEQYSDIKQQTGKIHQIEIDIMMANIRKLYERMSDLSKLNIQEIVSLGKEIPEAKPDLPKEVAEKVEAEPIVEDYHFNDLPEDQETEETDEVVENFNETEPEITIEDEKLVENNHPIESVPEIDKTIIAEKEKPDLEATIKDERAVPEKTITPPAPPRVVKPVKKEEVDLFSMAEKETIADKFKEVQKSINDKISTGKRDVTLADKIGKTSILNLKSAIGINDKFLFINELFKGDIQEYNKTIEKLNACIQLEDTASLLDELKQRLQWDEKPDTYQKLEDLLIRKFL